MKDIMKDWNNTAFKSAHLTQRQRQRGISALAVRAAYSMGSRIRGKGCIFHVITRKVLLRYDLCDKWLGITVVTCSDRKSIQTAYRHYGPSLKYFRCKKTR